MGVSPLYEEENIGVDLSRVLCIDRAKRLGKAAELEMVWIVGFHGGSNMTMQVDRYPDLYNRWRAWVMRNWDAEQDAKLGLFRPYSTWCEEDGPVLWSFFPIEEPPYFGSPLNDDWPFTFVRGETSTLHWHPLPEAFRKDQS